MAANEPDKQNELPATVQCIMSLEYFKREDTHLYRPLGVFEKYCMSNVCLYGQEEKPTWAPD